MKSFFAALFFALPLFANEIPKAVYVSGGYSASDKVPYAFSGTLDLIASRNGRTHYRGQVVLSTFNDNKNPVEKRMNLLAVTVNGKTHLEFALFEGPYSYEFKFETNTLIPEAHKTYAGTLQMNEQNWCGPLGEYCYRWVDSGRANLTVSY